MSRFLPSVFALVAFGALALASPVASSEVAKRGGSDSLTAVLNLCLDLQVKVAAILEVIGTFLATRVFFSSRLHPVHERRVRRT